MPKVKMILMVWRFCIGHGKLTKRHQSVFASKTTFDPLLINPKIKICFPTEVVSLESCEFGFSWSYKPCCPPFWCTVHSVCLCGFMTIHLTFHLISDSLSVADVSRFEFYILFNVIYFRIRTGFLWCCLILCNFLIWVNEFVSMSCIVSHMFIRCIFRLHEFVSLLIQDSKLHLHVLLPPWVPSIQLWNWRKYSW